MGIFEVVESIGELASELLSFEIKRIVSYASNQAEVIKNKVLGKINPLNKTEVFVSVREWQHWDWDVLC
jgi:hypothetical protein